MTGMRSYRTVVSLKDVDGNVPTVMTEPQLDEFMGFLKPAPGEPSAFEESLLEREHQRALERERSRSPFSFAFAIRSVQQGLMAQAETSCVG